MSSETEAGKVRESGWRETIKIVVHALILAMIVRIFFYQPFNIPSGSMKQTLLVGDYLFVSKLAYGYSRYSFPWGIVPISGRIFGAEPKRGDVVVFKLPRDNSTDFIKRVIGLPGETLEVRQKKVYINGKPLDEPYTHFLTAPAGSAFHEETSFDVRDQYGPVTIPPDHYFMMGDNRDNSQDSRYWGFLPRENIKGRALLIYWSYEAEREEYEEAGAGETVKGLFSVFTHFFTRTRWDRMLHQIR